MRAAVGAKEARKTDLQNCDRRNWKRELQIRQTKREKRPTLVTKVKRNWLLLGQANERERERAGERDRERARERDSVCVCVREREREGGRERLCVCVMPYGKRVTTPFAVAHCLGRAVLSPFLLSGSSSSPSSGIHTSIHTYIHTRADALGVLLVHCVSFE